MTGSGMGCPDWPKCFGYYIPPTDAQQLEWTPEREYKKGQVIIMDESLEVAITNFNSGKSYDPDHWERYTKHDYAVFNPWHTWIEFINRLLGALAGLATLLLAVMSLRFWKTKKMVTLFSWLVVFGMGFQAWLGATVVYSVLEPVKISLHMMMALLIVALLLYVIYKSTTEDKKIHYDRAFLLGSLSALGLTIIQIILGTQVRQYVDVRIDEIGYFTKNLWLNDPTVSFYIHRSLSIAVVLLNVYLFYRFKKLNLGHFKMYWVLFIIGIEVLTGMAMYYLHFPFASQPLHLVLASLLFGVQCYIVLDALKPQLSVKTS